MTQISGHSGHAHCDIAIKRNFSTEFEHRKSAVEDDFDNYHVDSLYISKTGVYNGNAPTYSCFV